jgi:hypothetical protein
MTPSLSNFIFSLLAGAVVLGAIVLALVIVSTNDRIARE